MRLLFSLAIFILSTAAHADNSPRNTEQELTEMEHQIRRLVDAGDELSKMIVPELLKRDKKSFIVSPLGTALALSIPAIAARVEPIPIFQTAAPADEDKRRKELAFLGLTSEWNSYGAHGLHRATALLVPSGIQIDPAYIAIVENDPYLMVRNFDPGNPTAASNSTNKWCRVKTYNHINHIINPDDLNANTGMVLVNALYFKGKLVNFSPAQSTCSSFSFPDGTSRNVVMMTQVISLDFGVYPKMNADFIKLHFKIGNGVSKMSMFVILPKTEKDFIDSQNSISDINVRELLDQKKHGWIKVSLPKFSITSELQLQESLKLSRMGVVFNQNTANFSGMLTGNPPKEGTSKLYMDKVIQKFVIDVSEGSAPNYIHTESGRVTAGSFTADRPFYAIIATTDSDPRIISIMRCSGLK